MVCKREARRAFRLSNTELAARPTSSQPMASWSVTITTQSLLFDRHSGMRGNRLLRMCWLSPSRFWPNETHLPGAATPADAVDVDAVGGFVLTAKLTMPSISTLVGTAYALMPMP